jgi:hypothetical protein
METGLLQLLAPDVTHRDRFLSGIPCSGKAEASRAHGDTRVKHKIKRDDVAASREDISLGWLSLRAVLHVPATVTVVATTRPADA